MMNRECIFCGNNTEATNFSGMDGWHVKCPNCGIYNLTEEAQYDLPSEIRSSKRYLISGLLRERSDLNITDVITTGNFKAIFDSNVPKTIRQKLDKLLSYLYRKTQQLDELINVDLNQYAIGYAKNSDELRNMLNALVEEGYLRNPTGTLYALTLKGIERAENLISHITPSKQCFVAMWFNDNMNKIYTEYIEKAIRDTGYDPVIIAGVQYNDDICDRIIAEIRKSKFIVADYTGNRGGVYYESGFAQGLGLDVIMTCHEDWFKKDIEVKRKGKINELEQEVIVTDSREIHFDINHYNFIVWKNGDDLYKLLKERIEATIY